MTTLTRMTTSPACHRWSQLGTEDAFLRMAAAGASRLFWIDGATALAPGGHNGPYFDVESPARNSAHWLATMAMAHELTGEERFRRAGKALVRFLLSDFMRIDGIHIHRQRFPKDWTNGVIGPAWVSEGLMLAGRHLKLDEATEAGAALLRGLGFDQERALWQVSDPATGSRGTDRTVNHQVFCSAIAAEFSDDPTLTARVDHFLERAVGTIVRTGEGGVLEHHVPTTIPQRIVHSVISSVRSQAGARLQRAAMPYGAVTDTTLRDRGYHVFTLYSVCRLVSARQNSGLATLPEVRSAASAVTSIVSAPGYAENPYAFAYNPVGFELLSIATTPGFEDITPDDVLSDAYQLQMEQTSEPKTGLLTRSTPDPLVLSARGYELGLLHV